MLRKTVLAFVLVAPLASVACGGTTFVEEEGDAASAGKGGSTGGGSPTGGTGGSTGGGSATGGNSATGGASTGGSGGSGALGGTGGGGATGGNGGSVVTGGSGGVGGTSTGGAGGSTGGLSGTGGGGMGGISGGETGGGSGLGGTGGCDGICPRIACLPPIWFTVMPSDQAGLIQDLTLDAPEELGIQCFSNGGTPCSWWCQSANFNPPQGEYSITLEAPGFAAQTVEFAVTPPQPCGCCGCGCQNYLQRDVILEAATDPQGGCCADTNSDAQNCGACNNACVSGVCTNGTCAP